MSHCSSGFFLTTIQIKSIQLSKLIGSFDYPACCQQKPTLGVVNFLSGLGGICNSTLLFLPIFNWPSPFLPCMLPTKATSTCYFSRASGTGFGGCAASSTSPQPSPSGEGACVVVDLEILVQSRSTSHELKHLGELETPEIAEMLEL